MYLRHKACLGGLADVAAKTTIIAFIGCCVKKPLFIGLFLIPPLSSCRPTQLLPIQLPKIKTGHHNCIIAVLPKLPLLSCLNALFSVPPTLSSTLTKFVETKAFYLIQESRNRVEIDEE